MAAAFKCLKCGATFKSQRQVVGHLQMKRDNVHEGASLSDWVEVDGPLFGGGLAGGKTEKKKQASMATPAAPQKDPRLDQVCTDLACIKAQIEALTKTMAERPKVESTPEGGKTESAAEAPPEGQAAQADHRHKITVDDIDGPTTEEILDHMIECKDGKCTPILRRKVLTNWSRLFPGLSILSKATKKDFDEWIRVKKIGEQTAQEGEQAAGPEAEPKAEETTPEKETSAPEAAKPAEEQPAVEPETEIEEDIYGF